MKNYIHLRSFRNRELNPHTPTRFSFERGIIQNNTRVDLIRREDIDVKYPNFEVYEANIKNCDYNGVPCKAQIISKIFIDDLSYTLSYTLQYDTIHIHDKCETLKELTRMDLEKTYSNEGLDNLPIKIWKQFGDKNSKIVILLNLKRFLNANDPSYNLLARINSDNITGELYHSVISRILVLKRKS